MKPPAGPQLSEDTLEGLTERIAMRQPLAAYACYQKIIESGICAVEIHDVSAHSDYIIA